MRKGIKLGGLIGGKAIGIGEWKIVIKIYYIKFFSKIYFLCIVFSCMSTIKCNGILVFIYY